MISAESAEYRQAEGLSDSSRRSKHGGDHRNPPPKKMGTPKGVPERFRIHVVCDPCGVDDRGSTSGGVATLNHRLLSCSPSGWVNFAHPTRWRHRGFINSSCAKGFNWPVPPRSPAVRRARSSHRQPPGRLAVRGHRDRADSGPGPETPPAIDRQPCRAS